MRRLIITENHGQYVVETSAGVRAVGASLASALQKLVINGSPETRPPDDCDLAWVSSIFSGIRPSGGPAQIHEGQEGA